MGKIFGLDRAMKSGLGSAAISLGQAAIAHFVDCLLNGKQPLSLGEDGLRMMKLLDALYQSAETGDEVQIQ